MEDCNSGRRGQGNLTGKKGHLGDFEQGWVFQKLLIYWDVHGQPSLGVTDNRLKCPVDAGTSEETGQTGSG